MNTRRQFLITAADGRSSRRQSPWPQRNRKATSVGPRAGPRRQARPPAISVPVPVSGPRRVSSPRFAEAEKTHARSTMTPAERDR